MGSPLDDFKGVERRMKYVHEEGTLEECLEKVFNAGAMIMSNALDVTQYIYASEGTVRFEDGCILGEDYDSALDFLQSLDWTANTKWWVAGYLTEKEKEQVKKIEKNPNKWNAIWHEMKMAQVLELPWAFV